MYKNSLLLTFCTIFLCINFCYGAEEEFPQNIEIINRKQANYLSPENTMSARRSALLNNDLNWADETMAKESLQEQVQDYQKAGIDRSLLSDLEKKVKETFIVNKIPYKDAVLLVVNAYGYDGSIQSLPFPFIKENGLWKFTNKFAEDEILLDYLYYVPPLFDGKGQKPNDANSFLGYEKPTQVQTELSPGTDKYTLHIYYGKTIEPATFTAELNKNNITSRFSPAPFTDQEVELALQPGRNVLVLSIEGTRKDGKKAKDSDRLVFIVP
ncbi:MAG: hypothetical protein AB1461_04090 [Thermodesulfobacteriota bacterium]